MNTFETTGFDVVRTRLAECANTPQAKQMAFALEPLLSERELRKQQKDTTQGVELLSALGAPPIPRMENMAEILDQTLRSELLTAEELEETAAFLAAVKRMISYLEHGKARYISLAYYSENLCPLTELQTEIERSIRNGRVDDYASSRLRDVRRQIAAAETKMREKAEHILSSNKACMAENFLVTRSGRLCLPVRRDCKSKIDGAVVDKSSTGATLFIEPKSVQTIREELWLLRIDEEDEERRIIYTLMEQVASHQAELRENMRVIIMLDFIFAKAKLTVDMKAIEPEINTERRICLVNARNPLLPETVVVPLNFTVGNGVRGVVVTGPNTGGKTVAIKTVALMSLMAGSGLRVPCEQADITMNSQVLCDIGDGQSIEDNLSTFSSHIVNIMDILSRVNHESLVLMDELGSGTDPAEGMGIAIAILEELRAANCLFLVTTHYPEVKEYANRYDEIVNARMGFDRESLKPLYQLELGKAGDSCALYIARRLGVPSRILTVAAKEAYGEVSDKTRSELQLSEQEVPMNKKASPKLEKVEKGKDVSILSEKFHRGDSVMVSPEQIIGIIVKPVDDNGLALVQIKKEKQMINHKRLKLYVEAKELYPEDYDFSIIFDSVEERKKHHDMQRKYVETAFERSDYKSK